jgi:hypothetical protein
VELVGRQRPADGGLMARPTHVYMIDYVDSRIGENIELLQQIANNSYNIDYGEMIHAHDGNEEGITTFTDREIESLKEFLADIRTWEGGVRQFLVDEQCDPEKIERIMADESKSQGPRPWPDGYDQKGAKRAEPIGDTFFGRRQLPRSRARKAIASPGRSERPP